MRVNHESLAESQAVIGRNAPDIARPTKGCQTYDARAVTIAIRYVMLSFCQNSPLCFGATFDIL